MGLITGPALLPAAILLFCNNTASFSFAAVSVELNVPVQHTENPAVPAARTSAGTKQFQVRVETHLPFALAAISAIRRLHGTSSLPQTY